MRNSELAHAQYKTTALDKYQNLWQSYSVNNEQACKGGN